MKCRKCTGNGEMYVLQSTDETKSVEQRVENYKTYQDIKKYGYRIIAAITCSLCNGFGKENV